MSSFGPNRSAASSEAGDASRRSSADMTRQLLRKREEEIDRRVADLKARLNNPDGSHSSPNTPPPVTPNRVKRTVSMSSDESAYQVNRLKPGQQGRFGVPSTFSDAEGSASDRGKLGRVNQRGQGSGGSSATGSAYPTNRRMVSIKRPSFVPTPATKKKKTWQSWFCPCYPGRRNAAQEAQAANNRYERQRLLAEEGRLGYGAASDEPTPRNDYSNHYAYSASPRSRVRSSTPRASGRLTPVRPGMQTSRY